MSEVFKVVDRFNIIADGKEYKIIPSERYYLTEPQASYGVIDPIAHDKLLNYIKGLEDSDDLPTPRVRCG